MRSVSRGGRGLSHRRACGESEGAAPVAEAVTPALRGLYPITPDLIDSGALLAQVEAVLTARPALLQYRNKLADAELRSRQAGALARLCRRRSVPLIVNDDAQLALRVGAAGVHLGEHDGSLAAARQLLGPRAIIGVSCYDKLDLAIAAAAGGASYVAFGSVYPSPTKPNARRASLDLLREAKPSLSVPICAIGGIRRAHAPGLIAAGVDLLAVISDLFEDPDPQSAAADYGRMFDCTR